MRPDPTSSSTFLIEPPRDHREDSPQTVDDALEKLGFALEDLALSMLSEENRLYMGGHHSEVEMVTKWRREIREAATIVHGWKGHFASTRGGDNVEPCRFCPKPVRSRAAKCKWHV